MNLPNKITIFRICCMPVMLALFLAPIPKGIGVFLAFVVYVFGSLSDMLDGMIARKYNLITDFGKFMDQIADKILSTTALVLVLFAGVIPWTWVSVLVLVLIVSRDIIISGVRQVAASKGMVIAADKIGKLKSLVLDTGVGAMFLFAGLRAAAVAPKYIDWMKYLGIALVLLGTVLAVVSCANYIVKAIPVLKEPKASDEANS